MILPSQADLEMLYDLAKRGNLQGIQAKAAELEQAAEQFAPFARLIRRLASNFEDQALITLIEQYLERS
jgi:hypothetical protein